MERESDWRGRGGAGNSMPTGRGPAGVRRRRRAMAASISGTLTALGGLVDVFFTVLYCCCGTSLEIFRLYYSPNNIICVVGVSFNLFNLDYIIRRLKDK